MSPENKIEYAEPEQEEPEEETKKEDESPRILFSTETNTETEEDFIEGEPFPLDMESLPDSLKEITKALEFDADLKNSVNKELTSFIEDGKQYIDEQKKDFYLKWFENNKDSEAIQDLGISSSLKLGDKVKIKLAMEAGAIEDLTEDGDYSEIYNDIQETKSEMQHIHGVNTYLKKTNDVPFEIRFEALNILGEWSELLEEEQKDIEDGGKRTKKQNQIENLLDVRKKLTESIKGESLDDEVNEDVERKLEDREDGIRSLAEANVGTQREYVDKILVESRNKYLSKTFKRELKNYEKENNLDIKDEDYEDEKNKFLDECFHDQVDKFDRLGIHDDIVVMSFLKQGYKAEDFTYKEARLFRDSFKNKKTGVKYFSNEEIEKASGADDYTEEREALRQESEKKWEEIIKKEIESQTKIAKQELANEAITSLIEETANSPIETGKTQEDINKRLKDLMWDLSIEKDLLKGDENKETKKNVTEFKKAGVKEPAKVIRDVYFGQGNFEDIPTDLDEAQEWMENSLDDIFGVGFISKENNVGKFFKTSKQQERWAKEVKNKKRKGFFSLFFEIISEMLDGGEKTKTKTSK